MTQNRLTVSIDTIYIEVFNDNGREYVEVSPSNLQGRGQGLVFMKGDQKAGCEFLSRISRLIGLDEVKPDEKSV